MKNLNSQIWSEVRHEVGREARDHEVWDELVDGVWYEVTTEVENALVYEVWSEVNKL